MQRQQRAQQPRRDAARHQPDVAVQLLVLQQAKVSKRVEADLEEQQQEQELVQAPERVQVQVQVLAQVQERQQVMLQS